MDLHETISNASTIASDQSDTFSNYNSDNFLSKDKKYHRESIVLDDTLFNKDLLMKLQPMNKIEDHTFE